MSSPSPVIMEAPATSVALNCFHCGEPCPDDSLALAGKNFCCLGCQTVFSLLSENGLAQFYELNARPGTRIRQKVGVARWAYLDDPAVQEKLFDFADKTHARVTLHLPQIHCVACVWLLENLFKLHPGVGKSVVNFSRREASIAFATDKIKFSELAALLDGIGYEPQFTFGEMDAAKKIPLWRSRTWLQIGLAGFAFGNIMIMSLPFYFGLDSFNGPWFKAFAGWLALLLALPVVTISAADFWRSAWTSVRQQRLTMEVPIVLGLVAIYGSSVFDVMFQRGPGYCDSLCGLIFFLLCGRLFQKKTYDRLTFDRDYKGFFPLSVVRIGRAGNPLPADGAHGGTRPTKIAVQHHIAHVLSCIAENEVSLPALGVAWDGTGSGTDGTVWGGEFFLVTGKNVERVAHLRPFRLPGGDRAMKEPRRVALGLLYELYGESAFEMEHLAPLRAIPPVEMMTLRGMLQRRFNSPLTTSMGRLFDAVASLTNLRQHIRFEGQAAMELEFAADGIQTDEHYPLPLVTRSSPFVLDWAMLALSVLADATGGANMAEISAKFHNALAESVVAVAKKIGENRVVLSGGCFQNRYLTERVVTRLRAENFSPYWHQRVPPNDGGIALGQVVAARRAENL